MKSNAVQALQRAEQAAKLAEQASALAASLLTLVRALEAQEGPPADKPQQPTCAGGGCRT